MKGLITGIMVMVIKGDYWRYGLGALALFSGVSSLALPSNAVAFEVDLSLAAKESFVNNRSATISESGSVTTLSPSLALARKEGKAQYNLNYRLDANYYQGLSEADRTDHTLLLGSSLTHIPSVWNTQIFGRIERFNSSADGIQNPNRLLGASNSQELQTAGISTFLNQKLSRTVKASADIGANWADYENSSSSTGAQIGARLFAERNVKGMDWSTWVRRQENSSSAVTQAVTSYTVNAGYSFSRKWRTFVDASKSEVSGSTISSESQLLGVEYSPNQRLNLKLAAGQRESDSSYLFDASYMRKRVAIAASYKEDLISPRTQAIADLGNATALTTTFQDLSITPSLQKRADVSVTVQGKRSSVSLQYFGSTRESAGSATNQSRTRGFKTGYNRQLSRTSNLNFALGRQDTEQKESNTVNDLTVSYSKTWARNLTFSTQIARIEQSSDNSSNEYRNDIVSFTLQKQF